MNYAFICPIHSDTSSVVERRRCRQQAQLDCQQFDGNVHMCCQIVGPALISDTDLRRPTRLSPACATSPFRCFTGALLAQKRSCSEYSMPWAVEGPLAEALNL